MSEPQPKPNIKLPGEVACIIETIGTAEEVLSTLPDRCWDILRGTGGEMVTLKHRDSHGNVMGTHGFVFLYEEKKNPTDKDMMQIELRAEGKAVTLIVRKDNLYLIGFFSRKGFFELESREKKEDRLLPEAKLLDINVNYNTLLKFEGGEYKQDISTKFNLHQLTLAICAMDNESSTKLSDRELKRHLSVIIVMILESTRSPNIMEAIMNGGSTDGRGMKLRALADQIKDWSKGSKALWEFRNDPRSEWGPKLEVREFRTVENAAVYMRAVHCSKRRKLNVPAPAPPKWIPTPPKPSKKESRSKQSKGESSSKKQK